MADGQLQSILASGEPVSRAIVVPDDGLVLSFADLAGRVDELARTLAGLGVTRSDRVCMALPNGPEIIELLLATAAIGAAAAPLNPAYTTSEFEFYLGDLAPRLLVLPQGDLGAARAAAPADLEIVDLVSGRLEVDAAPTGFEPGGADDIALLLHTSGTTSRPKQVPLLQRNLVASARTIAAFYELGPDDVSYCVMPLFHIHGLVASTFSALVAGGSVVVPRRVAPRRFWSQAREAGITWFSAGPTLHQMLLDQRDEQGPPASLRFVRSCSSALSPDLMRRAEEEYGVPMLEAYGMTEASHQMASNPLPPAARRPGSVGIPSGVEIGIVDPQGAFLPEGQAGEVVIRGPGVTLGYVGNDEANAASFFDGWFRTGDRGLLEQGYLRLEGRLKELIIRGGENISPAEVEDVLRQHPAVADAACFGIPDEKYGEQVGAAVALSGTAGEDELIAFCRERLTAVKVPSRLFLVPEITRTPTGKLQRRRIADALLAG